jgi:GNAT superfamily N-acetyltransferase
MPTPGREVQAEWPGTLVMPTLRVVSSGQSLRKRKPGVSGVGGATTGFDVVEVEGMLFASRDLVARIERAECGLLEDAVRAVADLHPERGAAVIPLAGGVAAYSGEGSPLNKVAGLGFAGMPAPADLEAVERFHAHKGCPVQVELPSLADPDVALLLTGRGYRLVAFENVLGRDLTGEAGHPRSVPATDIEVEETDEEGFGVWLDTVVTGFLNPDDDGVPPHESFARETLEEVMGDMARAPGFARYLAYRDGQPAGAASMRLQNEVAQLTGASTLPAHRRRGVQTALLARRLEDAARRGCGVATVTTQPGSRSQRNAQRNHFELLYTRAVLVLNPSGRGP